MASAWQHADPLGWGSYADPKSQKQIIETIEHTLQEHQMRFFRSAEELEKRFNPKGETGGSENPDTKRPVGTNPEPKDKPSKKTPPQKMPK